jgi:hypothetical protein
LQAKSKQGNRFLEAPKPSTSRDSDSWDACPEGELERMVDRLRSQRRNFAVNRVAVAAAVLVSVVMVAILVGPLVQELPERPTDPAREAAQPISCGEVRKLLPAYARHKLDADLTARVERHLAHCRECRRRLSTIPTDTAQNGREVFEGRPVAAIGWSAAGAK